MNSTAVHEAGHAVIGRVLGMVCGHATIVPDDDSLGHSIAADPWMIAHAWEQRGKYRDMSSVFRGRILGFMAGAEAEAEILHRTAIGDGDDRYQIGLMLYELSADESRPPAIGAPTRRASSWTRCPTTSRCRMWR
jgi:ATP-dependent Zn protease